MDYEEQIRVLHLEILAVVKRQGETLVLLRDLAARVGAIERGSCATAFDAVAGA